jgi:hypothetical protein
MSKKQTEAFSQFLKALGGCTRSAASGLLKAAAEVGDETLVVGASALLCSFNPHEHGDRPVITASLDALAACRHPAASAALVHAAQNATIGRIKVEAVRRLGSLDLGEEARELLRTLAKEGFKQTQQFANDVVSVEDFRVAALESLGKMKKHTNADVDAVLGTLSEEAAGNRDKTRVFEVAVETLYAIGEACPLDVVLEIAKKFQTPYLRLHILAVCSSQKAPLLRKHASAVAALLCSALDGFRDEQPMRERLLSLATKSASQNGHAERARRKQIMAQASSTKPR